MKTESIGELLLQYPAGVKVKTESEVDETNNSQTQAIAIAVCGTSNPIVNHMIIH